MKNKPSISMRDFFELPEIKVAQAIQKTHKFSSVQWQNAEKVICDTARYYGAQEFVKSALA